MRMPLADTHDLRLPSWGPFTKKYTGISHLPDLKRGLRFDLSVFPGYYRRQVLVPNAKWESGFHVWEAAPDLSYYSYRYEIEWKDQVYCDVSFSEIGAQARLVRSEFVNHTDQTQNLALHYMAYLNFPPVRTYSDEIVHPVCAVLPSTALWLDALDYDDLRFATPRPQDTLVYDGMWRAEVRGHGFTNGTGVGQGFGRDRGDWAEYTFQLASPLTGAILLLRYRSPEGKAAFILDGMVNAQLELPPSQDFTLAEIGVGDLSTGSHRLRLISEGSAALELDGLALLPADCRGEVWFEPVDWQPVPEIITGPRPNSLLLKYPDSDPWYGLAWVGDDPWELRELYNDELDRFLRYYVQEHVQKVLRGNGQGHFTNVFVRPIEVKAHSHRVLYALVCSGSRSDVERELTEFDPSTNRLETMAKQARAKAVSFQESLDGEQYSFSQERMAATVLTNVVYPVYTRRSYVRHYTPGKWWDCLYTWDSGFIGLGLAELDIERAVDCLNAYTMPVGDPQAAFLHHGSMVPVQHYLFHELWNRTQDRDLLYYFYPRLRQYYRFFAGRLGSSTTRAMQSSLLKTWDYFYNSGGWDDYPPQVYVHRNHLESTTTPVISTSHGIRIAKILQQAALAAGEQGDVAEYQQDIDAWVVALNQYAWDEQAGYFGYVCHNHDGVPQTILRHESGQNYNMGLDGTSPLFAGVCTPNQEQMAMERLTSSERMWTPIGLCTVDKQAAYYRIDGYWNGAVWFPQQWFYWKAMLDLGYADFAAQIAHTALDTWKAEVDSSYHCFEHFIVQSGRGAGWHQFSGLSTPILSWYGAYFRPGRLTVGFDTWVHCCQFSLGNTLLTAELENHANPQRARTVIAVMKPATTDYCVTWNDQPVDVVTRHTGVLEITLPGTPRRSWLKVHPVEEQAS